MERKRNTRNAAESLPKRSQNSRTSQTSHHITSTHLVVLYNHELLLGRRTGEYDLRVLQDGVPLLLFHVRRDFPSGHDDGLSVLGVFEVGVSCERGLGGAK